MDKEVSTSDYMQSLVKEEVAHKLNEVFIGDNLPIWRLIRFNYRLQGLKKGINFSNDTQSKSFNLKIIFTFFFKSLSQFLGLIIYENKKETLILSFPRLFNLNGSYFDKFTDPIIDLSLKKDDYLILQTNNARQHSTPREHCNDLIYNDFEFYYSFLIAVLFSPVLLIVYFHKINTLKNRVEKVYKISNTFYVTTAISIGVFWIKSWFAFIYLKRTKAKRVILVSRYVFNPFIYRAKKMNVPVFELQHGATIGATPLYSGSYNTVIDPDYFLSFGEKWRATHFSIPDHRMINIGWAYSKWLELKNVNIDLEEIENSILVVSSPAQTDYVIETILTFANEFSNYQFYLRLHPQEQLSVSQLDLINNKNNVMLDDTKLESTLAVLKYKYVLGVMSTVLYEAVAQDKRVGVLQSNVSQNSKVTSPAGALFSIRTSQDFKLFLSYHPKGDKKLEAFSRFNVELFKNEVLNK